VLRELQVTSSRKYSKATSLLIFNGVRLKLHYRLSLLSRTKFEKNSCRELASLHSAGRRGLFEIDNKRHRVKPNGDFVDPVQKHKDQGVEAFFGRNQRCRKEVNPLLG
jgi:hypothetical protein